MSARRTRIALLALSLGLAATALIGLAVGGSSLPLGEVVSTLADPSAAGPAHDIVWSIRLPRMLLAMIVGAGLAVCGCVLQGLLQNPLAEPFTLGVSGGAAVGVTVVVLLGGMTSWLTGAGACLGALAAVLAVTAIASHRGFSPATLLLAGVILNFLCSALVMFLFAVATSREIHRVMLWLMGDLSSASHASLAPVAVVAAAGGAWFLARATPLDLLSLGEERARHLGLDARRERRLAYLAASLVTGVCVASCGIIGFVGLLVPHLLRYVTGPSHARLLPAAALGGALLLALCDTVARTAVSPIELPVGVVTGVVGGVFSLGILLKSREWKVF